MDSATDDVAFIDGWAEKRGIPRLTRQKWRERGKVPHRYRLEIVTAAAAENRKFDPASFDKFTGVPREIAPHDQAQRKSA
jgi:hypothetical protein